MHSPNLLPVSFNTNFIKKKQSNSINPSKRMMRFEAMFDNQMRKFKKTKNFTLLSLIESSIFRKTCYEVFSNFAPIAKNIINTPSGPIRYFANYPKTYHRMNNNGKKESMYSYENKDIVIDTLKNLSNNNREMSTKITFFKNDDIKVLTANSSEANYTLFKDDSFLFTMNSKACDLKITDDKGELNCVKRNGKESVKQELYIYDEHQNKENSCTIYKETRINNKAFKDNELGFYPVNCIFYTKNQNNDNNTGIIAFPLEK